MVRKLLVIFSLPFPDPRAGIYFFYFTTVEIVIIIGNATVSNRKGRERVIFLLGMEQSFGGTRGSGG